MECYIDFLEIKIVKVTAFLPFMKNLFMETRIGEYKEYSGAFWFNHTSHKRNSLITRVK